MLAEDSKFEGGSAQNAGMVVWSIFDGLGEPWAGAHVEVLRVQSGQSVTGKIAGENAPQPCYVAL